MSFLRSNLCILLPLFLSSVVFSGQQVCDTMIGGRGSGGDKNRGCPTLPLIWDTRILIGGWRSYCGGAGGVSNECN